MKFNYGQWVIKPGIKACNCAQIREISLSEDGTSVYVYAVDYTKDERGLGGPILEMLISSPLPDIIRLQSFHFRGDSKKYPAFELSDEKLKLGFNEADGKAVITSGETSLEITRMPASFTYFYKGKKLTAVADYFGKSLISYMNTPDGPYMRAQLDTDIGEKIYGFGEKFTPFVKNGQVVEIWNEDGGTATELSYKSVPFYVTNRGYGVFVNDTGPVSFEVCSEAVTKVQFSVPGEKLDFMMIGGGDMKSVIANYTALSGKPALPPAWTFGLWLSTSFTTSYDEKTVNGFIDGMTERGIPLSVFHIDCFWMKENEWCGFEWDKKMFPDPKSFIDKIKGKGIRVCVWINPYIGQKSKTFDEAMKGGYLLKRANGDVWQWDLWQGGLAVIDFTNPAAVEWYKDKLRALMNQGVDAFKTDFGERIPTDCVYYDGSDPVRMHNYYAYLYNKIVFEVVEEFRGKGEACLFARSATAGGQKFPVHWGGDCNSTFPSMYESLRGGLSLCMSGFGFWSHDIGGFEGTASKELYKRWVAFGLLSTHSRLHASTCYRVPWLFGKEAVNVCRKFTKLKNTLMPYLYGNAVETAEKGLPSMRPMVMEFDELGAEDCDRQYLLGDSLLVAPVMSADGVVDVYLPKGKWTHLLSGKQIYGKGWRREKHSFFSLPLYVRENTVLPMGGDEDNVVYDYAKDLTLFVYALTDHAKRTVYTSTGEKELSVSAKKSGNKITVELDGNYSAVSIVFVGIREIKKLTGGKIETNNRGIKIVPEESVLTFETI